MYHVSTQDIDEHMINVHYYYYHHHHHHLHIVYLTNSSLLFLLLLLFFYCNPDAHPVLTGKLVCAAISPLCFCVVRSTVVDRVERTWDNCVYRYMWWRLLMLCFSGGTSITVMGVGLDLIQKPQFFVTYGGQFFTSVSASCLCTLRKQYRD